MSFVIGIRDRILLNLPHRGLETKVGLRRRSRMDGCIVTEGGKEVHEAVIKMEVEAELDEANSTEESS